MNNYVFKLFGKLSLHLPVHLVLLFLLLLVLCDGWVLIIMLDTGYCTTWAWEARGDASPSISQEKTQSNQQCLIEFLDVVFQSIKAEIIYSYPKIQASFGVLDQTETNYWIRPDICASGYLWWFLTCFWFNAHWKHSVKIHLLLTMK